MFNLKFSNKLDSYLKDIREITGRRISFLEAPELQNIGMFAAFYLDHPSDILILINPYRIHDKIDFEQSVAHELAHGYLTYRKDDPYSKPSKSSFAIIQIYNMIDDIVANKIIQEKGFEPYCSIFLDSLENDIDKAKNNLPVYAVFNPTDRKIFIVERYISAWGILKYCHLDQGEKIQVGRILREFQNVFCGQLELIEETKNIIRKNNIFNAEGRENAITRLLSLYNLHFI